MRYLVIFLIIAGFGYYAFGLGYDRDCCKCISKEVSRGKYQARAGRDRELDGFSSLGGAMSAVFVQTREYVGCRTGFQVSSRVLRDCRLAGPEPVCRL